eukprot:768382-Hanusia_phi.AAC.3
MNFCLSYGGNPLHGNQCIKCPAGYWSDKLRAEAQDFVGDIDACVPCPDGTYGSQVRPSHLLFLFSSNLCADLVSSCPLVAIPLMTNLCALPAPSLCIRLPHSLRRPAIWQPAGCCDYNFRDSTSEHPSSFCLSCPSEFFCCLCVPALLTLLTVGKYNPLHGQPFCFDCPPVCVGGKYEGKYCSTGLNSTIHKNGTLSEEDIARPSQLTSRPPPLRRSTLRRGAGGG